MRVPIVSIMPATYGTRASRTGMVAMVILDSATTPPNPRRLPQWSAAGC